MNHGHEWFKPTMVAKFPLPMVGLSKEVWHNFVQWAVKKIGQEASGKGLPLWLKVIHGGKVYFIFPIDIGIYGFDRWWCCSHKGTTYPEKGKEKRLKFMGPNDITEWLNYPSLETPDEEFLVIWNNNSYCSESFFVLFCYFQSKESQDRGK